MAETRSPPRSPSRRCRCEPELPLGSHGWVAQQRGPPSACCRRSAPSRRCLRRVPRPTLSPSLSLSTQVLVDEKCAENAARLGPIFRQQLLDIGSPLIQSVRGREPLLPLGAVDRCRAAARRAAAAALSPPAPVPPSIPPSLARSPARPPAAGARPGAAECHRGRPQRWSGGLGHLSQAHEGGPAHQAHAPVRERQGCCCC